MVTIDAKKMNDFLGEDSVINQYIEEDSEIHKTKYSVEKKHLNLVFFIQPFYEYQMSGADTESSRKIGKQFVIQDPETKNTYTSFSRPHKNNYVTTLKQVP